MLQGRNLNEIAVELERQRKTRIDFVAPTSFLLMTLDSKIFNRKEHAPVSKGEVVSAEQAMSLTPHAHRQIAQHLNIPAAYYERMKETQPELLARNVNTWMETQPTGTRRLIRTLDNGSLMRAYLSDRYMILDHWDVLDFLLPTINAAGLQIISSEITETRMYVKAVSPRITGEIAKGDIVQSGLTISNSEIGLGRIQIAPLMYRLACLNGLIVQDMSVKRNHVGRRISDDDLETNGSYSPETIRLDIKAFLSKARDSVKAALNQTIFDKIIQKAKVAAGVQLSNIEEAIEDVTGKYSLFEEERASVMKNLINDGDTSKWGLVNAITATAHRNVKDYDRSTELEKIGGDVLVNYMPRLLKAA